MSLKKQFRWSQILVGSVFLPTRMQVVRELIRSDYHMHEHIFDVSV